MLSILAFLLLPVHQDSKAVPEEHKIIEAVRVTAIVVPKGSLARLISKSRDLIMKVAVSDEKVLRICDIERDYVLLEGLAAGISRLTLTDKAQTEEKLIVIVEATASGLRETRGK